MFLLITVEAPYTGKARLVELALLVYFGSFVCVCVCVLATAYKLFVTISKLYFKDVTSLLENIILLFNFDTFYFAALLL